MVYGLMVVISWFLNQLITGGGPSCRSTLSFKHWQKVPDSEIFVPETSRYHETWNQRSTEDVRQPHKIIDGSYMVNIWL